jgi:hypothetical protein
MATKFAEFFNALAAPFHPSDVKIRSYDKAKYVTARTVMNRLDDVAGPENWRAKFVPFGEHAVYCSLRITLPDGSRMWKSDVGAKTSMAQKQGGKADPGEDDKGGVSDAFKRAAVMFGIGRYLYDDGMVTFVADEPLDATKNIASTREPTKAEKLSDWCVRNGHVARAVALATSNYGKDILVDLSDAEAETIYKLLKGSKALAEVPAPEAKPPPPEATIAQAEPRGPVNENGTPIVFGWPTTGPALFAWCKRIEEAFGVSIVKAVDTEFVLGAGSFPRLWKEWDKAQVERAALFVARRVRELEGYDGQFDEKAPDLIELKGKLMAAGTKRLGQMGNPWPKKEMITAYLASLSVGLADAHGGRVIGNLYQCQDAELLGFLLEAIEADIEESEALRENR